jgi:hypothetical protein
MEEGMGIWTNESSGDIFSDISEDLLKRRETE